MENAHLVSLAVNNVSLLNWREHVVMKAVWFEIINSSLVVMTERPADIMAVIVFAVGVEFEGIEGVFEVKVLEVAVVLIEVVFVPVPGVAFSCARSVY